MAKKETKASAALTLKFEDGSTKTYEIFGTLFGDIATGAMKIEADNGGKFVFIPNPDNHKGKRKRFLEKLHNL